MPSLLNVYPVQTSKPAVRDFAAFLLAPARQSEIAELGRDRVAELLFRALHLPAATEAPGPPAGTHPGH